MSQNVRPLSTLSIAFSILLAAMTVACAAPSGDSSSPAPAAGEGRAPNVLLIVADDMGFSDIGPFGSEIATPTLDALAHEGVQLTNFHVLPTCSPSRSVLLSGMDNHRAGLGTMAEMLPPEWEDRPGYEGYLNLDVAALPEVMQAAGYRTYMIGKWHLGHDPGTRPHDRGFGDSFVLIDGGGSHWSDQIGVSPTQPMHYERNGEAVPELPDDFYSTRYYTDSFLEWIERDRDADEPFFAYMAYTAPHDPLHAPREYIEKYAGRYDGGWDELREERLRSLVDLGIIDASAVPAPLPDSVPAWSEISDEERAESARDMEVYAAMIDYLDEQIGRVLDALRESGEYDNTLIIFFSDNGANGHVAETYPGQTDEFLASFDNSLENRGAPGSFIEPGPGWSLASMAPSRLFKAYPAEGGIRSPMLVKLPGEMSNAGTRSDQFLHMRDIMPTILDVAGISDPPATFAGREVLPMQGQSAQSLIAGEVAVLDAGFGQVGYELFGMKAFFSWPWKIVLMAPPFGTGDWQLYNLEEDPGETNDLSAELPERLAELEGLWQQYRDDNGVLEATSDVAEEPAGDRQP